MLMKLFYTVTEHLESVFFLLFLCKFICFFPAPRSQALRAEILCPVTIDKHFLLLAQQNLLSVFPTLHSRLHQSSILTQLHLHIQNTPLVCNMYVFGEIYPK